MTDFVQNCEYSADLIRKARERAISDKFTTYFKKLIDEDQWDALYPNGPPPFMETLKDLKGKCDNILDTKNGKMNWCFFTVNFKEDVEHEEIVKTMSAFCEKCAYIDNYMWSIEQRSTDPGDYYGFHVHILFSKDGNPPSKIQRAFKTKFFDKYVGKPEALDYKYVENPEKRIKYILGVKDDKEKGAKTKCDKVFRDTYGYQAYYTKGTIEQEIDLIKQNILRSDLGYTLGD